MSAQLTRALARRTQQPARLLTRNASTTSEAANTAAAQASKAKDAASGAASQASQGLSRVSGSAGPAMSKAAGAAGNALNALGKVGGRTGQVIGLVQSMIPPTVYYSKVGLELAKLVAKGRGMSPPSAANVQKYYEPLVQSVRTPDALAKTAADASSSATSYVQSLRNASHGELATAGVVLAEIIGFFTVGEIIGRMKIVGYRSSGAAAHAEGH